MKSYITCFILTIVLLSSCQDVLEPTPYDLQIDELTLKRAADVPLVRIGLYSSFRAMTSSIVIAGDFTADHIKHNGTFASYQEFGTKQITATNSDVTTFWGAIYGCVYVANFILERLPTVTGVTTDARKQLTAEAKFLRGLANFYGVYTFGDIPLVTTTDQTTNRNISRTAKATVLAAVLADYQAALADLPDDSSTGVAYLSKRVVQAALARFYLYQKNYAQAENYASLVINSGKFSLVPDYNTIVKQNFTAESIFEVGYTQNDDPATLNTLFVSRREVIPSDQVVISLNSLESGTRVATISFDVTKQQGNDNGWTVRKYGTAVENNANIVVFRLAEMCLIRAEARAQQNKLTGTTGAVADLNLLRTRAKSTAVTATAQADILLAVERERQYELAFEGHRWYDLVRTGRAQAVMSAFSPNWNSRYELWPIPQSEILRNPGLQGAQNPGY
ncbi:MULTISPECIES: RagB/SusD family nutrient uptake outer membrane protein [unclassified Spirosoma]|uniref:RagB/SusD family nutrient uptake outer membrane protein n=1 Tax=unclassified Spirosoma TaxID=2621999 RepID=UPI00096500CA|nr:MULTISPECIES: RagB/SusD family nutrient uptake outer membrane protein [unclassified Spirosoma]MBN8822178.1 RagB/SusD family nutrient uptake outer membrane protein [Spirosoma sp.]OJW80573.1 MAG: RagB/SusD family nutrient uptake outer membrane protein [Spirosoma sp. 48-14]